MPCSVLLVLASGHCNSLSRFSAVGQLPRPFGCTASVRFSVGPMLWFKYLGLDQRLTGVMPAHVIRELIA